MCFFDEGKVRSVTDVVWSTKTHPERHQVVTTFVEMIDAAGGGGREDVYYIINTELQTCIREARDILDISYNSEVHCVSD